jgi:Tfp pilus assembly protein PilN
MRAVNLIPEDQRGGSGPAGGRSGGGAYAVVVLLAGLAGLALLYGAARRQISTNRAQVASLTLRTQQTQLRAAQLAPYVSFLGLRGQRQQAVAALAGSRFDWAHAFHEFGRVLPRDASISSLSGAVGSGSATPASPQSGSKSGAGAGSAAVTSATPPGSVPTFTLVGCATSQSAVARTLNRLRLIDGVTNVTLQNSTSAGAPGGSGGGGCPGSDTSFTVQITFYPLPSASSASASNGAGTKSSGGAP